MNIQEFREKYTDNVKEIADKDYEKFNIFKVLGLTNYEIRHSNFLAWLMKNEDFRVRFIKACGIDADLADNNIRIRREIHFNEEVDGKTVSYHYLKDANATIKKIGDEYYLINKNKINDEIKLEYTLCDENNDIVKKCKGKKDLNNRYIDLNIIGDDFTVTIENKVDSQQHDYQCIAYRNYMKSTYSKDKGFTNYFVYLAKEKPDDFDESSNEDGLYPEYRFISYKDVLEILREIDESEQFDEFKKQVIKQYESIIEEWELIPDEYVRIIRECDIMPLVENGAAVEILNTHKDELSEEEERFLALVNNYYLQTKRKVCKEIEPILKKMLYNEKVLFDDYNGYYAKAMPVSELVLNYYTKAEYLIGLGRIDVDKNSLELIKNNKLSDDLKKEIDGVLKEDIKDRIYKAVTIKLQTVEQKIDELKSRKRLPNIIKKYEREDNSEKEKKELIERFDKEIRTLYTPVVNELYTKLTCFPFQTIDFRAPMSKYNDVSVAIISGINTAYSRALCNILRNKLENNTLGDVFDLLSEKWDRSFKYFAKNGSGYNVGNVINVAYTGKYSDITKDVFEQLTMWSPEGEEFKSIGKKSAVDCFRKDYQDFLLSLFKVKGMNEESIVLSLGDFFNYFVYDNENIENGKNDINELLKNNMDYKKHYEKWLEENSQNTPIVSEEIIKKLKSNISILSTQHHNIYNNLVDDLNNGMKVAMKTLKDIFFIDSFKTWVEHYKEQMNINKKVKTSLDKIGSPTHNALIFVWGLDLVCPIETYDEQRRLISEEKRIKRFYDATMDGLKVLEYDEIFKSIMIRKEINDMCNK